MSPPSASQQRLRVVGRTGATDWFVLSSTGQSQMHDRAFFLPARLNQPSFFDFFFESSIMRKIGPGSRLGCRACCVSGMALSEGGFVFNARLVYFASEQFSIFHPGRDSNQLCLSISDCLVRLLGAAAHAQPVCI